MTELTHISLFTGIGGIDLAAEWAGFKTVLMVENNEYCQKVLKKHWPHVPLHSDIFDLSVWELGENDGMCYNKLCEAKNKEQQIAKTYNWLMMPREAGELIKSVSLAAKWCPYLRALQTEVGNTVLGNVVQRQCVAKAEQMPMAGIGCEGQETPTGKTVEGMSDTNAIKKPKLPNGEGVSLHETIIPANSAGSNPEDTTTYEPTISTPGQNIPKSDLNYLTELLYAKYATTKCTRKAKRIHLLSAGTPCQPASVAGQQRGSSDDRWLWPETYRIIRELQSEWILLENVRGLLALEGGVEFKYLLSDLETSGYETKQFLIPACAVNAPHRRDRIFIVAYTDSPRLRERWGAEPISEALNPLEYIGKDVADTSTRRLSEEGTEQQSARITRENIQPNQWAVEPEFRRVLDEFSQRLDCNRLTDTPYGIMVLALNKEVSDATPENTGRSEVLPAMPKSTNKEEIQRNIREQPFLPSEEVLQSGMYGNAPDESQHSEVSNVEESNEVPKEQMRPVPDGTADWDTSYQWQPSRQLTRKSNDAMLALSQQMALGTRESYAEASELLLQDLWRACEEIGYVPETLSEIPEVWQSLTDQEKDWLIIRCCTGDPFHSEWPGVLRVATGIKNRIDRLRALGNAVVPQQIYPILQAIADIENRP